MVQFSIYDGRGAMQCRINLEADATVEQLLRQLVLVKPAMRSASEIRNDARQVTFHATAAKEGVEGNMSLTLLQARLVERDSTAEVLVVTTAAVPRPSEMAATAALARYRAMETSSPPNRTAASAEERIIELFKSPVQASAPHSTPAAVAAASTAPTRPSNQDSVPIEMDPRQLELQRRLYAQIQQQQIDENLMRALEDTPEVFAKVTMLYVKCTINQVPIKAFVDSGAQQSIMNEKTAERCGLIRLMDRRMRGTAVGVGRQEIAGRIHMVSVNLAGLHIPFAFYVLVDQDIDIIIGLDQLRRHQMLINLRDNCLTVDNINVPFLSEYELRELGLRDEEQTGEVPTEAQLEPSQESKVGKRPSFQAPQSDTAIGGTSAMAPEPHLSLGGTLPESERQQRIEGFMAFSGITDVAQATALLEMAQWDADAAAELFFGD